MPELKLSLTTHKFDKLSNRCIETNPYRLHCIKGVKYFEHPVNSGNLYFEDLEQVAGRLVNGDVDLKASHVKYVAPLSAPEKMVSELEMLKSQNDHLMRELEALARDKQAKELAAQAGKAPNERLGNARPDNKL